MLEDRGYDVSDLKNYTEDEMKIMLNEHNIGKFDQLPDKGPLDIILEKHSNTTGTGTSTGSTSDIEKIYVKYRLDDKFKGTTSLVNQINEIYANILTSKDTLIIINISRVLMKIGVKDKIDEEFVNNLYISKHYFVQIFGLENFLFNVSHHQLVPKHRILSKAETQKLLNDYNCSINNLPTIKRDDAQAKYIGLKPKQVCEIIVNNVTSGIAKKFRYCVNN